MKDKVVLITGANRGIGRDILHKLNKDGYLVIGTSRSSEGAKIISDDINPLGADKLLFSIEFLKALSFISPLNIE